MEEEHKPTKNYQNMKLSVMQDLVLKVAIKIHQKALEKETPESIDFHST
jgi:hypothetical protein